MKIIFIEQKQGKWKRSHENRNKEMYTKKKKKTNEVLQTKIIM